jgi:hypothetical protein
LFWTHSEKHLIVSFEFCFYNPQLGVGVVIGQFGL